MDWSKTKDDWHRTNNLRTIQINHQLDATISPVFYLTFTYTTTAVAASGFTFGAWWQQCCWSWSGRHDHDQQHCYHHAPTVKPEAATTVELLMMSVRTPKTCWAVNKHQVIKWRYCCIWVVNLFEVFCKLVLFLSTEEKVDLICLFVGMSLSQLLQWP
jgi:hypothetical protein